MILLHEYFRNRKHPRRPAHRLRAGLPSQPFRGSLRVTQTELGRYFWRLFRIISKGWILEVCPRKGEPPQFVILPYRQWQVLNESIDLMFERIRCSANESREEE